VSRGSPLVACVGDLPRTGSFPALSRCVAIDLHERATLQVSSEGGGRLTGNFARAGDALGLTQSSVKLFDRSRAPSRSADEGRRFLRSAAAQRLEEAATDVAGSGAVVRGRLRINVDPFFVRLVLTPCVRSTSGHSRLKRRALLSGPFLRCPESRRQILTEFWSRRAMSILRASQERRARCNFASLLCPARSRIFMQARLGDLARSPIGVSEKSSSTLNLKSHSGSIFLHQPSGNAVRPSALIQDPFIGKGAFTGSWRGFGENYDRRAAGGSGSSTRSNLAGRGTPSGSGEAVPPSLVIKATLPYSPGRLLHAALEGPINSSFMGSPATMNR
jgi:hypothetical protein